MLKTKAWDSKEKNLSSNTAFGLSRLLTIVAIPPPFLPSLKENKTLQFSEEASVRTIGGSVPCQVSVKKRESILLLLSKNRSFTIKICLIGSVHLKRPMLMVCEERSPFWGTG